jgi:hypothetical protein
MVLMAGSHNSLAFKSLQIGEEEEEKMALTERALLAAEAVIAEDESTSTTNLKTASVNTLLLECEESSDSHPEVVQVWQPCSTQPGRRSSCKSHSSGKLCNYLKRHRTFLVSVSLCLLAWIIFTVVTLYTLRELQWQCRTSLALLSTHKCPADHQAYHGRGFNI